MASYLRPPDDVYWHFKRLALHRQVGAEYTSWEDDCLYRVNAERRICRVVDGEELPTIDSLPLCLPAGARVMTGTGWGFHMHISTFYQQIIARVGEEIGQRSSNSTLQGHEKDEELSR